MHAHCSHNQASRATGSQEAAEQEPCQQDRQAKSKTNCHAALQMYVRSSHIWLVYTSTSPVNSAKPEYLHCFKDRPRCVAQSAHWDPFQHKLQATKATAGAKHSMFQQHSRLQQGHTTAAVQSFQHSSSNTAKPCATKSTEAMLRLNSQQLHNVACSQYGTAAQV